MKKKLFYFLSTLLISIAGLQSLQACSKSENNFSEQEENEGEEEVGTKAIHGVCRQNLQWVSYSKVVDIANNISASNITVVRLGGVKESGSIEQVIHNINTFAQKGVKVELIQPMCMEMFPEGYQKVPGPNFKLYRMSDIDLDRFRNFMDELLGQITLYTPKDALIALELFNEANWGDFNGDPHTKFYSSNRGHRRDSNDSVVRI